MADGEAVLIPELPGPRSLGRHREHDPRSKEYPVREVIPRRAPRGSVLWWRRSRYDQNGNSSCTFEATAGTLDTSPFRLDPHVKLHLPKLQVAKYRVDGYRIAQRNDAWDGEEPTYYGSSGLAAHKAAKLLGLVPTTWEYRHGFSVQDAIDGLRSVGPFAAGFDWYESFDDPKKPTLEIGGDTRGGHEVEFLGYDEDDDELLGINSWGPWGYYRNGRFRMARKTFGELIEAGGDTTFWVPKAA